MKIVNTFILFYTEGKRKLCNLKSYRSPDPEFGCTLIVDTFFYQYMIYYVEKTTEKSSIKDNWPYIDSRGHTNTHESKGYHLLLKYFLYDVS